MMHGQIAGILYEHLMLAARNYDFEGFKNIYIHILRCGYEDLVALRLTTNDVDDVFTRYESRIASGKYKISLRQIE